MSTLIYAALFGLFLVTPSAVSAQESWKDELKNLLGNLTGDASRGLLQDISIQGETAGSATLEISYAGIPMPSQMALSAQVLGISMRPIPGFEVEPVAPSGESGSSILQVTYQGDAINRNDATVVDTKNVRYMRRWQKGETSSSEASAVADSGSAAGAEQPPAEIVVAPRRMGNTPEIGSGSGDSGSRDQPGNSSGSTTVRPSKPTLTIDATRPMVATVAKINFGVNLFNLASKASWSNDKLKLPFNGNASDRRGSVRPSNSAVLSDGKKYKAVLQTHPRWARNGSIYGRYKVTIPAQARYFESGLGFIRGAAAGDVNFIASFYIPKTRRTHKLLDLRLRYTNGVVTRKIPLPAAVQGKSGILTLVVHALTSPAQDWAVWINPVIR